MGSKKKPTDAELENLFAKDTEAEGKAAKKQFAAMRSALIHAAKLARDVLPEGAATDRLIYRINHLLPDVEAAILNPGAGVSGVPSPPAVVKVDEEE